jgi:hypothetical protein
MYTGGRIFQARNRIAGIDEIPMTRWRDHNRSANMFHFPAIRLAGLPCAVPLGAA